MLKNFLLNWKNLKLIIKENFHKQQIMINFKMKGEKLKTN